MSVSLIFTFLIYNYDDTKSPNNEVENSKAKLTIMKLNYQKFLNLQNKDNLAQNIIKLFDYLKYHKINLVSFDYNKKLHIVISSKKRDDLYKFLLEYKNNSKIIQLEKQDNSKIYEMMVEIEIWTIFFES